MTLNQAKIILTVLKSDTNSKSEIRVYKRFIALLTKLEYKNLNSFTVEVIEKKLDTLNLKPVNSNKTKHFKKLLYEFELYLRTSLSLYTKAYFMNIGLIYGASIGLLVGILFLQYMQRSTGISMGLSLGSLLGIALGAYNQSQAKLMGHLI